MLSAMACAKTDLYVALVGAFRQMVNAHRKALLLEISDGKFIGVCQKMIDANLDVIVLQVIHQMRPVAFHLLVGSHRAEDDLREPLFGEDPKTDATDHLPIFDDHHVAVFRIEHHPGDVLLGHPGQLHREDALQLQQPEQFLGTLVSGQRIVDHLEFDQPPRLFRSGTLVSRQMFQPPPRALWGTP